MCTSSHFQDWQGLSLSILEPTSLITVGSSKQVGSKSEPKIQIITSIQYNILSHDIDNYETNY